MYGTPQANSLDLLQRYFTKYPEDAERVVICIKGGAVPGTMKLDGSPEGARRSVENCVRLLAGTKKLDVFEYARVDSNVPLETTITALADLIKEGQIGGIGLSEVSAETVHRASKVHPIAMVENEVSLFTTDSLSRGVASACHEHSIPMVPYSPLAKGFLTGQIRSLADLPPDDRRHHIPRFSKEKFPKNMALVDKIRAMSEQRGCTPGQLALAWVLQLSQKPGMPVFIPIPGSTSLTRAKENAQVVELSAEEVAQIDFLLAKVEVAGDRTPAWMKKLQFG